MLEDEADEDVVEGRGLEWQVKEIELPKLDIRNARACDASARLLQRGARVIEGGDSCLGAVASEAHRLSACAASHFENETSCGIPRIGVEEVENGARLCQQTLAFDTAISMDVTGGVIAHVLKGGRRGRRDLE